MVKFLVVHNHPSAENIEVKKTLTSEAENETWKITQVKQPVDKTETIPVKVA